MKVRLRKKILRELMWLLGIFALSLSIEYAILKFVNMNPILSVKIQGLIGLLVVGYGLRVSYRIWKEFQRKPDYRNNGVSSLTFDPENTEIDTPNQLN